MNRKLWTMLGMIGLLLAVVGCGDDDSGGGASGSGGSGSDGSGGGELTLEEPVRLVMNFGVPGSDAVAVPEFQDAAELAVAEINAAGGIGGQDVEYEIVHTPIDPQQALTAINLAYTKDPTVLFGGVSSAQVLAAARTMQDGGVPYLQWSAADRLARGEDGGSDWTFRVRLSNEVLTESAARYVVEELGAERVGLVYLDSEYGISGAEALRKHLEDLGATVGEERRHALDATDLTGDVLAMRDMDAIIAWTFPNQLALLIRQLQDNDISMPVMTTESGAVALSQGLIDGDAVADMYAVSQCDPLASDRAADFVAAFEERHGYQPDGNAASLYDAIHLVAQVIEEQGSAEPEAIRDGLRTASFEGICTDFEGDGDTHDLAKDSVILEWSADGTAAVVSEQTSG